MAAGRTNDEYSILIYDKWTQIDNKNRNRIKIATKKMILMDLQTR